LLLGHDLEIATVFCFGIGLIITCLLLQSHKLSINFYRSALLISDLANNNAFLQAD